MSMVDRRAMLGGTGALLAAPWIMAARGGLDLALVNARIWTGRGDRDVTAVGIAGDRIVAVGAGAVKAATTRATRIVDCRGGFVMPAFIDNHTHFLRGAAMLRQPSLRDAATRAEFTRRIAVAAQGMAPGRWIEGGHWDEQLWGGELPTREWIDAVTPDTPVAVHRLDLHMVLLNSLALRLAGIDRDTPAPDGGVIVKDAKGEPTGILKDNAARLAERAIPALTEQQTEETMRAGIAAALAKGVAQVHSPEIDWSVFHAARRLRAKGPTGLRFYSFVPLQDWARLETIVAAEGRGDDWVRWGGLKGLMDGSLGSRTALFHDAYDDAHDQRGVRVFPRDDIARWVKEADRAGLHVTVHAIGDQANDELLDIYADVAATNGARDRRFRIEHAQHLSAAAIPRFARQKVIASVQPYHAIDDGRWAVKRIGETRLRGTYAFRSLIDSGATVTFGSDWPVAPIDPLAGVFAAVARETIDGANPAGWHPEQRTSIEQALTAYTTANAYAGFQEARTGAIAQGCLADLVLLSDDPRTIPVDRLPQVQVVRTVVGGREMHGPDGGEGHS